MVSGQAPSDHPREFRTAVERQILQRFCAGNISSPDALMLKGQLAVYEWCDPDNRVVFEAIGRLRNSCTLTLSELREQLPAQATRMGFPDVNWENYFRQNGSEQREIRDLVDELLAWK